MEQSFKQSCARRLNRIEGQVRGIARMIENDRYCVDVITQIMAVRAALRRVQDDILREHVAHCVPEANTSGNKADRRQKIAELMDIITRSRALRLEHWGIVRPSQN